MFKKNDPDDKQEEQKTSEEEGIFNDGVGPIKYTHAAILRPIPYPAALVELNQNLPPLPEGIPVMIPPECPAPPRDYKERLRRQTEIFDAAQLALASANAAVEQEFTADQIQILDKIRKAITQGNPFGGDGETTREQTESEDEESDFDDDSD